MIHEVPLPERKRSNQQQNHAKPIPAEARVISNALFRWRSVFEA
jgi:hypothetical protein